MIDDAVLADYVEYLPFIDLIKLDVSLDDLLQLLQSFEFSLERGLLFETANNKAHILLLYEIIFLLLLDHIGKDLEHLKVIFKFVIRQSKFRRILLQQPIEMFMYIERQPLPIAIV